MVPLSHRIITSSNDNKPFTSANQAAINTEAVVALSSTQSSTQTSTINSKNTTLSNRILPPWRQTCTNSHPPTSQTPQGSTQTTKVAIIPPNHTATRAVAVHPITTPPNKLSRTHPQPTATTSTTTSRISRRLTPSPNNNSATTTKMSMPIILGSSNSNLWPRLMMSRVLAGIALGGVAARVVAAEVAITTEAAVEIAGEAPAITTITTTATEAVSCNNSSSNLAVALSPTRHRSKWSTMGHLEATSTETAATTATIIKESSFATATPSTPPQIRLKRSTISISSRCSHISSITTSRPPGISSKTTTSAVPATTISQPSRRRNMITINHIRIAVINMICQPSRQKLLRIGRRRFRIPLEEGTFRAMRTPGSTNATIIWVVKVRPEAAAVFTPLRRRPSSSTTASIIISNSSSLPFTAVTVAATNESSTTRRHPPKHQLRPTSTTTAAATTSRAGSNIPPLLTMPPTPHQQTLQPTRP